MWDVSKGVHISLVKSQMFVVERGFNKMSFSFIWVGPIFQFVFLGQYVGPWIQFWSWDVLFYVFFVKSMALFKLKRGNWVHLGGSRVNFQSKKVKRPNQGSRGPSLKRANPNVQKIRKILELLNL